MNELTTLEDVKNRMLMGRGNPSLLDRDVAALYGLETKAINQAVRNNPDKFPAGYIVNSILRSLKIGSQKFDLQFVRR